MAIAHAKPSLDTGKAYGVGWCSRAITHYGDPREDGAQRRPSPAETERGGVSSRRGDATVRAAWKHAESGGNDLTQAASLVTNLYATGGATDPTARNTVEPSDTLTAADVRRMLADLRGANVAPNRGTYYTAYIHPDVSYDLRGETGAAAWRDPHVYSAPGEIWSGEVGAFEGFSFIETPRAPVFADAGSSTTLSELRAKARWN